MTVTALVKWNGRNEIRYIEVIPYGIFVYDAEHMSDEKLQRYLMTCCMDALNQNPAIRDELSHFGDERPEGYIYAYGLLHHFDFGVQDETCHFAISYPNHELFTLYPGDAFYRRMDILE